MRTPTSPRGHIRHLLISGVAVAVLALSAPALAAAREWIDPTTLNPAPPDFFNAACYAGAGGTLCELAFADPANPIVDEPSGIICDGTELLFSQNRFVVGKRLYDSDGNLVQRHFREWLIGTFSNPATGASVPWAQHDTIIHNLAVPGDLDTGTISTTGLETRAWLPGAGSILLDAGTIHEQVATGDLIREGGPHPIRSYFVDGNAAALQPLCDALG
jgi:hypothetical protein